MKLVTVSIGTKEGASHVFPDMDEKVVSQLLSERGISDYGRLGQLTLVNVSQSVILVPFRIIQTISIDDKEVWRCPA